MINRTVVKYFLGIIGFVLLGVATNYGVAVYQYIHSSEYQADQDLIVLQKEYAADRYGGDTPEKTLELFIIALKKADIELASKYFLIDKQNEWKINLQRVKDGGELASMIVNLTKAERRDDTNEESARFVIKDEKNEDALTISIARLSNGIWKLSNM